MKPDIAVEQQPAQRDNVVIPLTTKQPKPLVPLPKPASRGRLQPTGFAMVMGDNKLTAGQICPSSTGSSARLPEKQQQQLPIRTTKNTVALPATQQCPIVVY